MARKRQRDESGPEMKRVKNSDGANGENHNQSEGDGQNLNHNRGLNGSAESKSRDNNKNNERREPLTDVLIPASR